MLQEYINYFCFVKVYQEFLISQDCNKRVLNLDQIDVN